MKRFILAAGALLAASAAPASAAMWPLPAGTYVRADLGVGFGQNLTFSDTNPGALNAFLGPNAGVASSTGNSVLLGAGIGFRINPKFRVDATFDYLPSLTQSGSGTGAAAGFSGHADLDAAVAMANVYVDLDGFFPRLLGPVQPFLTAGIGVASNTLGTASATKGGVPVFLSGATQTNFAWGVGVGAAYPLTAKLTIEASYKYLDLGGLITGTTATGPAGSAIVTAAKSGDLDVHTLTLSLRYTF
jgi:opacity protein-like surface antigen